MKLTRRTAPIWLVVAPALILLIGLRDRVGGDWWNYLAQFQGADYADFSDALFTHEPGYAVLEWLALTMDWGIYGVNFIAAAIFTIGLLRFCLALPRPWLGMVAATPYLIIVVSMGYTRQGLALGLSMLGLLALERGRPVAFTLWVMFAATFHNSAVVLLPIAVLAGTRRKPLAIAALAAVVGIGYIVSFQDSLSQYASAYVNSDMASEGALVRLAMNLLPAVVFIGCRKRLAMSDQHRQLWTWFSLISVALFAAYFLTSASTALDRIALYMLPLQLVVYTYLPDALVTRGQPARYVAWPIIFFYGLVLFVWLNYANNAGYWVPYRFYPLEYSSYD